VTWEMWGPGVNGYNAELDKRPAVDLARAKQLLADAGYPNGFGLTLDCPNDRYVNDEAICTAIVPMRARIGMKIELNAQTKAKHFGMIGAPNFDTSFYMLGWTPGTYDAHNPLFALLGTRSGARGELNDGGYSNPKLDALIDQIGVETDQAKRQAMLDQAIEIMRADVAYIPLHQQVVVWASKTSVELDQMADNFFPFRYVRVK
jgi:peptide/nickel transport system substrate-binding protein